MDTATIATMSPNIAKQLDSILSRPMTAFESQAAKEYAERLAQKTAEMARTEVLSFSQIAIAKGLYHYHCRVAHLANNQLIGLDVTDTETGQSYIPADCPISLSQAG